MVSRDRTTTIGETMRPRGIDEDPLWYKDAVIYELRVRSFYDSNDDGIGDFRGLTEKLDYLQALGVTALWLLPFYPTPLRDDGYDISDYLDVHPECGTLHDFKVFLREAHRRGLRVITELVLNHTSDRHPWFQRARRAEPGSKFRDFYVWSDTADRYVDARIIFKDFEPSNWTWDPVAKSYFWHRFYSHQPDLNYENAAVRKAMLKVLDFWLELGVDGLRLDAVPYLYEREGTSCENLPETHAFLRELRRHVDKRYQARMLLAEANQWPEDAVAYLDSECHMAFHFPVMPRLFMAVRMEDRFPILDIWAQTPSIGETSQWAIFLRNHDELTLEMVTDEERDYMYRAYAQESRMRINLGIRRRLAPLLGNNRRTIELMNALLFSLPGTPVVYYGDEIGMGDNVYLGDRDGVRTPMQWSGDRNAGFSRANPQKLILPPIIDHEYHYQTVNVEAQENNRHSLLWWMRRIIALRKQFKAFGRGTMEFLSPHNPRILAFVRTYEHERVLVAANLSRFVQAAELDLSRFAGCTPVEMFGRTVMPPVGADGRYVLTFGPHQFYWFSLEPAQAGLAEAPGRPPEFAAIEITRTTPEALLGEDGRAALERALPAYIARARWFGAKARAIKSAQIVEAAPIDGDVHLVFVQTELVEGDPETFVLPLGIASGERMVNITKTSPEIVVAELRGPARRQGEARGEATAIVYEAVRDPEFLAALLESFERRRRVRGESGELSAAPSRHFRELRGPKDAPREGRLLRAEQSNTSIAYGDRLVLKLVRRVTEGINPEVEMGRFLTEHEFSHTPRFGGSIDYQRSQATSEPATIAMLQGFVPNEGDAWSYTVGELKRYYERAATRPERFASAPHESILRRLLDDANDPNEADLVGAYLDAARLLGRRAAELHLCLGSAKDDPDFVPEPYTTLHQRSVYQSARNLTGQSFRLLRGSITSLPERARRSAERMLEQQPRILESFEKFLGRKIESVRIRVHGDLHLGQVLYTGRDFVLIDFEGEPARPISDRRRKRSALWDVAGMLRSLHYAAFGVLFEQIESGALGGTQFATAEPWAEYWQVASSRAFVKEYLATAGQAPFVPRVREELEILLDTFLLEKGVYELGYELNHRPDWIRLPLHGIAQVLGPAERVRPSP